MAAELSGPAPQREFPLSPPSPPHSHPQAPCPPRRLAAGRTMLREAPQPPLQKKSTAAAAVEAGGRDSRLVLTYHPPQVEYVGVLFGSAMPGSVLCTKYSST